VSLAPHVLAGPVLRDASPAVSVPIDPTTMHHLRRVLRLTDGAELSLTDGEGHAALGLLEADGARLTTEVCEVPAPRPELVLAQALSKGRRAEDAVRVACELGVDRIVPVIAERTQGRPDAHALTALVERWSAVAAAALEQSRGVRLPSIAAPVDGIEAVAPALADEALADESARSVLRLLAVPGAPPLPEVLGAGAAPDVVVLGVGPEGGWSGAEEGRAADAGWIRVGLGPTVLRTEHAGPVAVAVAAALLGRWRGTGTA
jgi:16S rRNA (uracil1498-N3)-methyltransferase